MFWILWINARNLLYIKKFNPKKAIRLADDKLKTKRFMEQRGIPVPWTYDVIRTTEQLWKYDFSSLPVDEWIIKPTKWSRGRGIYRVKRVESDDIPQETPSRFSKRISRQSPFSWQKYKVSGSIISDTTLRRYLLDILQWKNSLTRSHDTIILEELIVPGEGFKPYCEFGLADIRVICFNLIPVAAMLRVPTEISDGKANLDQWAIGFGVEVGTWRIISLSQWWKARATDFPAPYEWFENKQLPYWEDILQYSSKIQYLVNLWYLALDWVITPDGPKLLEINARAWLKFQNASLLPLKKRLDKIADIEVTTPEKWVEIAQSLFGKHKTWWAPASQVVYLSQYWTLKKWVQRYECVVQVDINATENTLSQDLWLAMKKEEWPTSLSLTHGPVLNELHRKKSKLEHNATIVLWRNAIKRLYIKPLDKVTTKTDFISPKNLISSELDQLHVLDQQVEKLWRRVNMSKILRPTNFLEELDQFITYNGNYNPIFKYKRPTDKKLEITNTMATSLLEQYFGSSGLQSTFAQLFKKKIEEVIVKNELIRAYKNQDFEMIYKGNLELFGEFDEALVKMSREKLFDFEWDRKHLGKILSHTQIVTTTRNFLKDEWFTSIDILFDSNIMGRMAVRRWEKITIKISSDAIFRKKELLATLAHEVSVHVRRHKNWYATGRKLLKNWTAWYISTEEWLAIHASLEHMPDEYERIGMYQKYFTSSIADQKTFSELASIIFTQTNKTLLWSFKGVLRMKNGIIDTSIKKEWTTYLKWKIYLDWFLKVENLDESKYTKLMLWKVWLSDLTYI